MNALLICKLLAMHLWEKLFINSKLFTLQKNLTRVHLWGTFASHWRRVVRVGYCGLSIKINAGIWLVGDTDTPWQWGVHWMETQFLAIFLLFKKGTATSIFNNSPALYRAICSTRVQILGDLSVWTPKLCFSEVRKHIVKFKSKNSPASFFTIRVNFDKIQFEDYCIYRPIFFVSKIHIVYLKTVPGLFDTPHK